MAPLVLRPSNSTRSMGTPVQPATPCSEAQWMWADVGMNRWVMQSLCPWRWSAIKSVNALVSELQATREVQKERPVVLWEGSHGEALHFANVAAAISRLQEHIGQGQAEAEGVVSEASAICGGWYGIDVSSPPGKLANTRNVLGEGTSLQGGLQTVQEEPDVVQPQAGGGGLSIVSAMCGGWYGVDVSSPVVVAESTMSASNGVGFQSGMQTMPEEAGQQLESTSALQGPPQPVDSNQNPQKECTLLEEATGKKKRTLKAWPSDASTEAPSDAGDQAVET